MVLLLVLVSVSKKKVSKKVSVSVPEKIGFEKSIGIGFENFWYRKKYRYRFRKILVSKKVSDSVSKNFGIGKKFRFRFRSDFWFRHSLSMSHGFDSKGIFTFLLFFALSGRYSVFSDPLPAVVLYQKYFGVSFKYGKCLKQKKGQNPILNTETVKKKEIAKRKILSNPLWSIT